MILVLHNGLHNSIQDNGRFGFAKMGVPVSGYMDAVAAKLANSFLANNVNAAVIEITFGQGKFKFASTTSFCVTGGDFSPQLNETPIKMNKVYSAIQSSVFVFWKATVWRKNIFGGCRWNSINCCFE